MSWFRKKRGWHFNNRVYKNIFRVNLSLFALLAARKRKCNHHFISYVVAASILRFQLLCGISHSLTKCFIVLKTDQLSKVRRISFNCFVVSHNFNVLVIQRNLSKNRLIQSKNEVHLYEVTLNQSLNKYMYSESDFKMELLIS